MRNEAKLIALEVVGWTDNPIPLLRPKGAECVAVLAVVKGKAAADAALAFGHP
jgi:hypothetical protein